MLTVTCESKPPQEASSIFMLTPVQRTLRTKVRTISRNSTTRRANEPSVSLLKSPLEDVDSAFTGVLTKPDRIPPGEEDHWLRFIRNDAEPLANGWFTVKQPGSNDLKTGITWADARAQEKLFFTSTTPWSSAETYCQKRFGTRNLTESLSKILSDLIKRRWATPRFRVLLPSLAFGLL